MIEPGDDIPALLIQAFQAANVIPNDGDVVVVSSKILSKAANRYVDLTSITPTEHAQQVAAQTRKDPRLVELILREADSISRAAPHVLIVRHKLGFTSANAGIDHSNIQRHEDVVLLLPENPDGDAQKLRAALQTAFGVTLGIIISDTHGRPFRFGNLNIAIGSAGVPALVDQRGEVDLFGRVLEVTMTPLADELAAASGLITGQADEAQPVVLMRGVAWQPSEQSAADLIRPAEQDLYR